MSKYFLPEDFDLLADAVALVPDLGAVAYAAKIVRNRVPYPIESPETLLALLDEAPIDLAGHEATRDQVKQFLPTEFFPLESEEQLLRRLFIAFQRASAYYQLEQQRAANKSEMHGKADTQLPSPQPYALD